jgi:hypothetical protein
MGLDFAIDALYDTGWHGSELKPLPRHRDGRAYPSPEDVRGEFAEHGLDLSIRYVHLFDCHRAEWRDTAGTPQGAVVGQSAEEAAVFALSQLRRHLSDTAHA